MRGAGNREHEYDSLGKAKDGQLNCLLGRERERLFLDKPCIYDDIDKGIVILMSVACALLIFRSLCKE